MTTPVNVSSFPDEDLLLITIITEPTNNDVLCGRGHGIQQHPGNQVYLTRIREYHHRYQQTPKFAKQKVVQALLQSIHDDGGRFLEPALSPVSTAQNSKTYDWKVMDLDKIINKTSQAFRDCKDPIPPPSLKDPNSDSSSRVEASERTQDSDEPDLTKSMISDDQVLVAKPARNDVLCGQGNNVQRHPGNRVYMARFQEYFRRYQQASGHEKVDIIDAFIQSIHKEGRRFLEPTYGDENKITIRHWKVLDLNKITNKTSQAFQACEKDSATFPQLQPVSEPTDRDVICGRGHGIQQHPGNQVYHSRIREYYQLYQDYPRHRKHFVVKAVLQSIRDEGGRFLEPFDVKYQAGNVDDDDDANSKLNSSWKEMDFVKIMSKTSQAFRDCKEPVLHSEDNRSQRLKTETFTTSTFQGNQAETVSISCSPTVSILRKRCQNKEKTRALKVRFAATNQYHHFLKTARASSMTISRINRRRVKVVVSKRLPQSKRLHRRRLPLHKQTSPPMISKKNPPKSILLSKKSAVGTLSLKGEKERKPARKSRQVLRHRYKLPLHRQNLLQGRSRAFQFGGWHGLSGS